MANYILNISANNKYYGLSAALANVAESATFAQCMNDNHYKAILSEEHQAGSTKFPYYAILDNVKSTFSTPPTMSDIMLVSVYPAYGCNLNTASHIGISYGTHSNINIASTSPTSLCSIQSSRISLRLTANVTMKSGHAFTDALGETYLWQLTSLLGEPMSNWTLQGMTYSIGTMTYTLSGMSLGEQYRTFPIFFYFLNAPGTNNHAKIYLSNSCCTGANGGRTLIHSAVANHSDFISHITAIRFELTTTLYYTPSH